MLRDARRRKVDPRDYELMKKAYGLDKPWPQAYVQWLGNLARFDLGRSITYKQPVTTIIGERIGPTMVQTASPFCAPVPAYRRPFHTSGDGVAMVTPGIVMRHRSEPSGA